MPGSRKEVARPVAEAHRTVDEVRRLLDEVRDPDELVARAAEVRERLQASLATLEGAVGDELRAVAAGVERTFEKDVAEAERRIRENPLGAVLVAAGLGLLAGLLVRRR